LVDPWSRAGLQWSTSGGARKHQGGGLIWRHWEWHLCPGWSTVEPCAARSSQGMSPHIENVSNISHVYPIIEARTIVILGLRGQRSKFGW
jgi:hypothetical protein